MGLTQSQSYNDYKTFLSNYILLDRIQHPTFGDIMIYSKKVSPQEKILEKTIFIKDESDYFESIKILNLKKDIKWPNYCQIVANCSYSINDCLKQGTIYKVAIEYFDKSLFQVIKDRLNYTSSNNISNYMEEPNAWRLLQSLVQLSSFFKRYNLSLGKVSPRNIMITSEEEIKFLDMQLLTLLLPSSEVSLKSGDINFAFSPEQLEGLEQGVLQKSDLEKSDVFCIAVTMICAITNENLEFFYDFSVFEIFYERIYKKIVKLREAGYSDDFTDMLVLMLEKDPQKRAGSKQILAHIQNFLGTTPVNKRESLHDPKSKKFLL
jgi:serine/threonine protein kinase